MPDVLALTDSYQESTRVLKYAGDLAARLGGCLTGLFVSEPIASVAMPVAYPEYFKSASDIAADAAQAGPKFCDWARSIGVKKVRWQVAEGFHQVALAVLAGWHDLYVLEAGGKTTWGRPGDLGSILMSCAVPCIVLPHGFDATTKLATVAVAWNRSGESMRALHDALPLLRKAGEIVLLKGDDAHRDSLVSWNPDIDPERYLAQHEISATVRAFAVDGSVGASLLRESRNVGADLLVMGAYGHSRFNEWVLGGATQHVLANLDLPVLLRH
jgi:nucleotide-binding universal stress UspA family protein